MNGSKAKKIRKRARQVYDALYYERPHGRLYRIWQFVKAYIIGIYPKMRISFKSFYRVAKRSTRP